ncbi:MAG: hypothetical protein FJ249_12145, partial [Nitrospira sp.]|nr:hypothetical protein [Nitrospira sp.]
MWPAAKSSSTAWPAWWCLGPIRRLRCGFPGATYLASASMKNFCPTRAPDRCWCGAARGICCRTVPAARRNGGWLRRRGSSPSRARGSRTKAISRTRTRLVTDSMTPRFLTGVGLCLAALAGSVMPVLGWAAEPKVISQGQTSGTEATLMSVYFRDTKLGWAVGAGGAILKTRDGGKRWKPVSSGTGALFTGVFFADASRGWIIGSNGTVLHSQDGG